LEGREKRCGVERPCWWEAEGWPFLSGPGPWKIGLLDIQGCLAGQTRAGRTGEGRGDAAFGGGEDGSQSWAMGLGWRKTWKGF
jgi:hypothetical protein